MTIGGFVPEHVGDSYLTKRARLISSNETTLTSGYKELNCSRLMEPNGYTLAARFRQVKILPKLGLPTTTTTEGILGRPISSDFLEVISRIPSGNLRFLAPTIVSPLPTPRRFCWIEWAQYELAGRAHIKDAHESYGEGFKIYGPNSGGHYHPLLALHLRCHLLHNFWLTRC